jgi:hypothetical protein
MTMTYDEALNLAKEIHQEMKTIGLSVNCPNILTDLLLIILISLDDNINNNIFEPALFNLQSQISYRLINQEWVNNREDLTNVN